MKRKNSSENLDWNHFEITYPFFLKCLMLLAFGFFGALFIACAGDLLGLWEFGTNNDLGVCLFFGSFTLLCGWGVLGTAVWKVSINGDDIFYRNMWGWRKHYSASDIEKIRLIDSCFEPGYNTEVYSKGRRIMKIDGNVVETVLIPFWCKERNIPVEEAEKKAGKRWIKKK